MRSPPAAVDVLPGKSMPAARTSPASRAVVALLLLALAGCSTVGDMFSFGSSNLEPPEPLGEYTPSVRIATVWNRNVGASAGRRYLRLVPAVDGARVFAAERNGDVSGYELNSGEQLWETDTDLAIAGGPGVGEGLVLVGSSDGMVVALNADTGEQSWRRQLSSEVLAAPVAAQGVVVVRTQDGKLSGLAATDGTPLWVYDRAVPALSLRGTSAPALAGDAVVAGFDSGLLVALALKDGQLLWESRIAVASGRSELERLVDIDADPVVADDVIYVVTFQGRVAAVDRRSGNVLWRRDMSSHAGMGVDERHLFITDDESFVWAVDRDNSASVWRQDKLARRALTPPTPFGAYVVVGDFEGYVHFLDREDGRQAGRVKVDGDGIAVAPVAVDELLLVYGRGGTLTALKTE
jgi:outer membrane protein assembly factor BamB